MFLAIAWPALAMSLAALRPAGDAGAHFTSLPIAGAIQSLTSDGATRLSNSWIAEYGGVLVVAWTLLSALLIARIAADLLTLHRRSRTFAKRLVDGRQLLLSHDCGPAVVGLQRMAIVLPEHILSFDTPLRELILRHEEEHLRERDPWLLLAARVASALLPWNVPLYWMKRRLRLAVEMDCDARVLAAHPDVSRYSRLLLTVAQMRSTLARAAIALTEDIPDLERRIVAMERKTSQMRWWIVGSSVAAVVALIVAACSVQTPTGPPMTGGVDAGAPSSVGTVAVGASAGADTPYFMFEVEKMAESLPGNPEPAYPGILRQTRQEGKVVASFVVDTSGRADMSTFKVLESTNALLTNEVRKVLPQYRFRPAEIGGRKVRVLVQLPFEFRLSRSGPR
jgi:TonB family protein